MGYFANGTEGDMYMSKYCSNCKNWTEREGLYGEGCPIMDFHMIDNYELCNDPNSYLDKFIPRSKDNLCNEKCVMFLPKENECEQIK